MIKKILLLTLLPLWLFANPTVLFINGTHPSKSKENHIENNLKRVNIEVEFKKLGSLKKEQNLSYALYDMVILDGVNARRSKELFDKIQAQIKSTVKKMIALNVLDKNDTKWRKGISYEEHKAIHDYLANGGEKNFASFADFMAHDIFKLSDKEADKALIYPKTAIYHPKSSEMFDSLEAYLKFMGKEDSTDSLIGIAMYQSNFGNVDSKSIDESIKRLDNMEGVIPVAFYYAYDFSPKATKNPYQELLSINGEFKLDALMFFQMMHQGNKRRKEFEKLNIPVFGALNYFDGNEETYKDAKNGISAMMSPFMLTIPENAGVINPMVISAKDKKTGETEIMSSQLDSFLKRVKNYTVLQKKENKEKKLAFFFWNYPSGQNAMGASFLNIPESLSNIFQTLKNEGYSTKEVNASFFTDRVKDMMALYYRDVNVSELIERDLCELYPLEKYKAWFNKLPKNIQVNIEKVWGKVERSNMLMEKDGKQYFTIPRMKIGNFVVLPQGTRGEDKKEYEKSYHNMSLPVNHGYLAVYLYAKEIFGVDAIVHMGTHGSQEWMQGKERGLDAFDSPNLAVGDTPVIYPFIVDDIGEAMNTKRRGSAVSLSHMTPPFSPAGLHDEMVEIHELMHQYNEMSEGASREKTKEQLIALSKAQNFDKELDSNASTNFKTYLTELHDYLDTLASANQPLGMHTYGKAPSHEHTILTVMQMLGSNYALLANEYASEHKETSPHVHTEACEHDEESDIQNYKDINKSAPYMLIAQAIEGKYPKDGELRKYLQDAHEKYELIEHSLELDSLVKALKGKYIPTSTGGDPIRSSEILPTGRNMYGFDPSKVPTKAAYETGKALTQELIANYYAKHGVYPDKLAFSLWSIETMRHYGVLEAQILYALGIKPKWGHGGQVRGMEIIPYAELKRPRVDVVVSATGLYRDAFPNVMDYLDKAVKKIVALKEKNNFVRRHALALEQELLAEGLDANLSKKLSSIRIFSNASGTYGTGIADTVMASGTWENDKGMSDDYMGKMGFAYGSGMWGEKVANKLYAKVLKGTDAAMFSRSSNTYGLLTSDDPFQYLGGIALAVRNIDGKTPEMYISNLRNKSKGKVETIQKFMSKELRTRYLHPQWIKAMQEEGFAGTLAMVGMVQNAWGWEVMDESSIRDDQWQEFVEVYVNDKHNLDMKEFFEKSNPDALAKISERFLEAIRKGYFKTDEKTIKKLVETYMEMANKHDVYTENEKFTEYVKGKAVAYGLSPKLPSKIQTEFNTVFKKTEAKKPEPKVKGQELVEQKNIEVDEDYTYLWFALFIFGLIGLGMIYGAYRKD